MADTTITIKPGRALEVHEYGDRRGHPAFFFHGLIGSHYQASYVAEAARRAGLRIIAPNRPGVGRSEFVARQTPLEAVPDIEELARALRLDEFSVIGISGGTPYALAVLYRLGERVRTTTIISGMGPATLPGALQGMDRRRRLILAVGSRHPGVARKAFQRAGRRFRAHPEPALERLIRTWAPPDQEVFGRREVFELFLKDIEQVFLNPKGAEGMAQELALYRNFGFSLGDLPAGRRVTIWHGLTDNIVPPAMAWKMVQTLPDAEAHLVPGGHFMAVDAAGLIIARLGQHLAT
jgi:pimeloyl-ACP methyl ester carboxylesterase